MLIAGAGLLNEVSHSNLSPTDPLSNPRSPGAYGSLLTRFALLCCQGYEKWYWRYLRKHKVLGEETFAGAAAPVGVLTYLFGNDDKLAAAGAPKSPRTPLSTLNPSVALRSARAEHRAGCSQLCSVLALRPPARLGTVRMAYSIRSIDRHVSVGGQCGLGVWVGGCVRTAPASIGRR
jgi:hypothetical protein